MQNSGLPTKNNILVQHDIIHNTGATQKRQKPGHSQTGILDVTHDLR